jgi:hypothetical protein
MVLHELASGTRIQISDYRGPLARGCKLDADAFLRAAELVGRTLARADILILNKFGKLECEGGGLRSLIAQALDHSLPIVIFVPRRNLDSWRDFVGELATYWEFAELPGDGTTVSERMGIDVRTDLAQTLVTPLPACATECTQVSRSAGASFSRWEKVPRRGG